MSTLSAARTEPRNDIAAWCRIAAAAALDFFFALLISEYAVGYLAGKAARGEFELTGAPSVFVFGAIALYFVIFIRFLGGTVWQRALGLR